MRKTITATLITLGAFLATPGLWALDDNALYQWTGKDGTPTYSPDPPPSGVDYIVVDAELNPLPVQPPRVQTPPPNTDSAPAEAGPPALYRWTGKDGTPTYSPDPPPIGIDYVAVDADLNPLNVQPPRQETAVAGVPSIAPSAAIQTLAPQKSIPKWKPVRYAQDPAKLAAKKNRENSQIAGTEVEKTSKDSTTSPGREPLSMECQQIRHEARVLESYFAEAATATEMDQAILKLQQKTQEFRSQCG